MGELAQRVRGSHERGAVEPPRDTMGQRWADGAVSGQGARNSADQPPFGAPRLAIQFDFLVRGFRQRAFDAMKQVVHGANFIVLNNFALLKYQSVLVVL